VRFAIGISSVTGNSAVTLKEGINRTDEPSVQVGSLSIADELSKLSKLKDQGVITAKEFDEMKKQLISQL
jgi:hypothetical protein